MSAHPALHLQRGQVRSTSSAFRRLPMPSRIARLFVCCLLLVASSTDVSAAPQPGPLHAEAVVRMLASGRDARPLAAQASADDAQSRARALALREQPPGPSVRVAEAAAAVADARRKAEVIAQAAGVALGPVVEITEQGGYAVPRQEMLRMAPSMADAAVPIAAGEVSFAANVTIVWSLTAP